MPTAKRRPTVKPDAIDRGFAYLAQAQLESGQWASDYGGPLFLTPGYVFAFYATKTALPQVTADSFVRYARATQNPDGGWGLHVESPSFHFCTILNYAMLRLLGVGANDPALQRARARILTQPGGALSIPSWGKYWLAVMRLYDWEGANPLPPELWLLPQALPFHPSRFWCHARVIYLPLSHLFGRRWQAEDDALLAAIRSEIYTQAYAKIDFRSARNLIAASDIYTPHTKLLDVFNALLGTVERIAPKVFRQRALDFTLDQIKQEQMNTSFIDLGPISKALDVIAVYAAEGMTPHTQRALTTMPVYLARGEDADLKMQGYNNSELWDTALAALALAESGRTFAEVATRAHAFIDANQVLEDVPEREKYFRDRSRGGWPFSNRAHGWPIVDCTALGIMAAVALADKVETPIALERLSWATDLLLGWQNPDGGWPTYEKNRGNALLHHLNPSEVFGDIMCDYSYTELTSSAMQGLQTARDHLRLESAQLARLKTAMARGEQYLRRAQRGDGSWEGLWAVCFTYGTWWGVWGLLANAVDPSDEALVRAKDFLLAHQNADGGWGESYASSVERRYVSHPEGSQVVMTAWSMMALAKLPGTHAAVARGADFLRHTQLANGDWPRQGITGVFNKSCMIHYRYYRNYFPLWALALADKAHD